MGGFLFSTTTGAEYVPILGQLAVPHCVILMDKQRSKNFDPCDHISRRTTDLDAILRSGFGVQRCTSIDPLHQRPYPVV